MLTFGFPFRTLAWLGFFGIILAAWYVLYAMADQMGMTLTGQMAMDAMPMESISGGMAGSAAEPMAMNGMGGDMAGPGMEPMPTDGTGAGMSDMAMPGMDMTSLRVLIPMWVIMMAAMMGPTFVPTARTYEDLIKTGAGTRAGFWGLVAGYLGVWFGFGAVIAVAHAGFLEIGLLSDMGVSQSILFSAMLLALAGLYQFTPAKDLCLEYCRSPMVHFLAKWRDGAGGGAYMGARIGLYCVACCWAIMALGFVGGAMNLIWMGIATLVMTLEKLPDIGRWMTRPLGLVFLGASGWQITGLF